MRKEDVVKQYGKATMEKLMKKIQTGITKAAAKETNGVRSVDAMELVKGVVKVQLGNYRWEGNRKGWDEGMKEGKKEVKRIKWEANVEIARS